MGGVKVVDAKEQTDASRELSADQRLLLLTARLREQDATARARWPNDYPSFGLSISVE
jgi:hypothetical protein